MLRRSSFALSTLAAAGALTAYGQLNRVHHAKILLEGNVPPTTPPTVVADLVRLQPGCLIQLVGDGTIEYQLNPRAMGVDIQIDTASSDKCDVTISLKGYKTVHATLKENAVILLNRVGDRESSTVSMTALNAPADAKKAYDRGVVALGAGKWQAAEENLEKAVSIYPDYASAWNDLGQALVEQSRLPEARAAWEHAVKADPKYIKPYLQLTRMAIMENRSQDASDLAEKALANNPVEYPAIYFYYAIAQHSLGHQDVAEKFAQRAIELDIVHEVPRAEFLLATLLDARGDHRGAIQHLNKYLAEAPKAADAEAVRQRVAALEQASSN